MDHKERKAHDELYQELEKRAKEHVKRVAAKLNNPDAANRVGVIAAIHLLAFVVGGIISSTNEKGKTVQEQANLVDRKLHEIVDAMLKAAGRIFVPSRFHTSGGTAPTSRMVLVWTPGAGVDPASGRGSDGWTGPGPGWGDPRYP